MDEHNVHQLWGCSPFIDLKACSAQLTSDSDTGEAQRVVKCLQVCPYDARHTIASICRKARHPPCALELYVYEEEPENLARHMLLLHVLLDGSLTSTDRVETLLELHGNAMMREKTAAYLEAAAKQLEEVVVAAPSCSSTAGCQQQQERDQLPAGSPAALLFDLTLLKYAQRDAIVEALQRCRQKVKYDMAKAWDTRCRRWYGDRYDFRRNAVDWDYHMRLTPRGTPGQDPARGSIVHSAHFRAWRLGGVAQELRECVSSQPNRSLLTTATGRTREWKDRLGNDRGRSVAAWGWWGDILNSPYHCFGTLAEEASLFRTSNKQFVRTGVDVAHHNLRAFLHELRTGERCPPLADDSPTVMGAHSNGDEGAQASGSTSAAAAADEAPGDADGQTAAHRASSAAQPGAGGDPVVHSSSGGSTRAREGPAVDGGEAASGGGTPSGEPAQCSRAPADAASDPGSVAAAAATVAPAHDRREVDGDTDAGRTVGVAATPPHDGAQTEDAMRRRAAELAAQEAAQYAAALRSLAGTRVVLLTGPPAKALGALRPPPGGFDVATLGHRHVHLLGGRDGVVAPLLRPGGVALVEGAKYVLQLTEQQVDAFAAKLCELAAVAGLERCEGRLPVPDACLAFHKPLPECASGGGMTPADA